MWFLASFVFENIQVDAVLVHLRPTELHGRVFLGFLVVRLNLFQPFPPTLNRRILLHNEALGHTYHVVEARHRSQGKLLSVNIFPFQTTQQVHSLLDFRGEFL